MYQSYAKIFCSIPSLAIVLMNKVLVKYK